jgi:hypothetical protein
MRQLLLCVSAAIVMCCGNVLAQPEQQTSGAAISYLNHALDVKQQNSLHRKSIDWIKLRQETLAQATGSQSPADTYEAIRFALKSWVITTAFSNSHLRNCNPKIKKLVRGLMMLKLFQALGRSGVDLLTLIDVSRAPAFRRSLAQELPALSFLYSSTPMTAKCTFTQIRWARPSRNWLKSTPEGGLSI